METGAVTDYIDVAQLVLYGFWIFFFGLIYYLRQEDRREGYPLESEIDGPGGTPNFFFIPRPKTFHLPHGGEAMAPNGKREQRTINIEKNEVWPGAPFVPTGDPMKDAVGPAAYAERADVPDRTAEGHAKIVPMRAAADFGLMNPADDPRGYPVVDAKGIAVGTVADLWVDRSESLVRYVEIELADTESHVLVPKTMARVGSLFNPGARVVQVNSIYSHQFEAVPRTAKETEITLLEEDKIQAYYSGGTLYADPERAEPLL